MAAASVPLNRPGGATWTSSVTGVTYCQLNMKHIMSYFENADVMSPFKTLSREDLKDELLKTGDPQIKNCRDKKHYLTAVVFMTKPHAAELGHYPAISMYWP
jgi:hypothetical protein